MQELLFADEKYKALDNYLAQNSVHSIFLVCDSAFGFLKIKDYFKALGQNGMKITYFSDLQPNPLYESVVEGVRQFNESGANLIIAVGGGSAMDVAKCIKLYSNMDPEKNYLQQPIVPNDVKLLAVPTTAGTGSEATRYAVIYYEGKKQSVTDHSIIPSEVLFDASTLRTLSIYQKKSTMMDALCHAIESFWSVNSTEESKQFSRVAIEAIISNMDGYLANDDKANAAMLRAAHTAGQAINITQTTGGHAMCYKLTSLYGVAHGHAAALVDRILFSWMVENTDKCIDSRGEQYLKDAFDQIASAMGCETVTEATKKFQSIFDKLKLAVPGAKEEDYNILDTSVNPVRLKNNPVQLDEGSIDYLYHRILSK